MSRKPFVTAEALGLGVATAAERGKDENRLTELVNSYAELNLDIKEKKKLADEQNAEIKELMRKLDITSFDGDEYTAVYSVRKKESFDEQPMIEWMKQKKVAPWVIKTKEYIDMDELENAIYGGRIDVSELDHMNTFKKIDETPALTIKKKKGAK